MSNHTYKIPRKNAISFSSSTCPKPIHYITSNIIADTTWSPDAHYILMNEIHVKGGATLTILPGTIIYANALEVSNTSSLPALVVEITGKLISNGTPEHPITFTSIYHPSRIFHTDPFTHTYTFGGGLGPFAGIWNGITICGEAPNNSGPQSCLTLYHTPYGGNNVNTYQFEMSYTRIYFAGMAHLGTNSLTLGAPSYYDKFHDNEILFGQGAKLAVYGGSLLVDHSTFGFTYPSSSSTSAPSPSIVSLEDGAQVYLIQNQLLNGLENIVSTPTTLALLSVHTPSDPAPTIRSIAFANNNLFLSLTQVDTHVRISEEGRAYLANQAYIGNCITSVIDLTSTTDVATGLLITTDFPTDPTLPENYIWVGPSAYEHANAPYYTGPTPLTLPPPSSQLVREIEFLTYRVNQKKLLCGHFLDIRPIPNSDLFLNTTDSATSRLVSTLNTLYFSLLPEPFQTPYYASGPIQGDQKCDIPCLGFFGHLLEGCHREDIYWKIIFCEDESSSSSSSSSSEESLSTKSTISSKSTKTSTSASSTISSITNKFLSKKKKHHHHHPHPHHQTQKSSIEKYLLPSLLMLSTLTLLNQDDE